MSDQKDVQSKPENIGQALSAVMSEVGYVQKKQPKGSGLKFSYAGEADLIAAIRPHFLEYGITVYPVEVEMLASEPYTTSRGNTMNRTLIRATYRFTHAESETYTDTQVLGEGADTADKSASKAMTIAYKYALRQTLLIETGDDPDKDQDHPPREAAGNGHNPAGRGNGKIKSSAPPDSEQVAYWESLTVKEKEVYRETDLVKSVAENVSRYDHDYAARGVLIKLYPPLREAKMWPTGKTFEDGKRRIDMFNRTLEYASLRDAGVEDGQALRDIVGEVD